MPLKLWFWPAAGFLEKKIVAQNERVIEDDRGGNFVLAKNLGRLGVIRAAGRAIRRGDEHGGNGMVARIAAGVGVAVKLFGETYV